jgi:hypothetical protein
MAHTKRSRRRNTCGKEKLNVVKHTKIRSLCEDIFKIEREGYFWLESLLIAESQKLFANSPLFLSSSLSP